MSDAPKFGITKEAHAIELLTQSHGTLQAACERVVGDRRRLLPAEREELRRRLAGVVGNLETLRVWLDKGAPRD